MTRLATTFAAGAIAASALVVALTSNHRPNCYEDEAVVTWGEATICTPVDDLPVSTQQELGTEEN